MPKYVYKCNHCEEHFEIYHGMMETQDKCVYCATVDPLRVPQMPFLKRSVEPKGSKVGDKVKEAIEANKAVLKDAKKDAKKDRDYFRDDN